MKQLSSHALQSIGSSLFLPSILCILIFTINVTFAKAQSTDPTPEPTASPTPTPESAFPKPSATPLSGDTTIDAGVKIESEMMAYRALKSVGSEIVKNLGTQTTGKKVAILNSQWIGGLRGYWASTDQLRRITDGYAGALHQSAEWNALIKSIRNKTVAEKYEPFIDVTAPQYQPDAAVTAFKIDKNIKLGIKADNEGGAPVASKVKTIANGVATLSAAVFPPIGFATAGIGAAIDLLSYARTNTTINGTTFTVPESAIVSEVYRSLPAAARFFPSEFPPNLNDRPDFVMLRNIQVATDYRKKAGDIVTSIDEIQKAHKQAIADKESLEQRQKEIPGELKDAQDELADFEKQFKGKKKPIDAIKREAELKSKVRKLSVESKGIAAKITKKDAAIKDLALELAGLYGELNPVIPAELVRQGYTNFAGRLEATGAALIGRDFTTDELQTISGADDVAKLTLIKTLSDAHPATAKAIEAWITDPADGGRLAIYLTITKYIDNNSGSSLPGLDPYVVVTEDDQLKIALESDDEVAAAQGVLAKSKKATIDTLKSLNAQYDKYYEDLTKPDATGMAPIALYLQSENLMRAMGCNVVSGRCDEGRALTLRVVDSGGNNRVKKNLVTMIATGSNVSHSGGAIAEYRFYDLAGNVIASNVCRSYEPYRKARNINDNQSAAVVECGPIQTVTHDPKAAGQ